ncbi:MAG TPA: glycosyltransferase family 4 protein [Prolixibacteraceae bacterium]|nr:glycosyltransferase family 4 protein [Prolixibacteraceae bacterium]
MKITHLIFSLNIGGSETMLVEILNHQIEHAEVNLIIVNESYKEELLNKIDKRINVIFLKRKPHTRNLIDLFRITVLLIRLRSDVLHCHNHNLIPLIIIPSHRKKAVLTLHTMDIPIKYLNRYHKLFAISNSVKNNIMSRGQIDSIVIYNGVSTETIQTQEIQIVDTTFKIICTSRLEHPHKGQHLAIKAIKLLKDRGISNIQLDLIGTGNSEKYLKDLTSKNGIENQVNFLGLKDRDYIYSHLKDYHLLIQPSLYEGFGLTVAEGMAAFIPVLISDIDGPMEIIENGKFGFYFKSNNFENMAIKIQFIKDNINSELVEKIVKSAYQHVKENFEISFTVSKYFQNY